MAKKIVVEHQEERYSVYMEIPAMPAPIKSQINFCSSREEVLEAVGKLLAYLPGLITISDELKREIEKLQIKTTRGCFYKD